MNSTRMVAVGIVAASLAGMAHAASFGFQNITNNNALHAAAGESQLSLSVVAGSGGMAQFTLTNAAGGMASGVRGVWIDNAAGVLAALGTISNTTGVVYTAGSSGALPGGESVDFTPTHALGLTAKPPPPVNGVNPGESLTWTYSIVGGFGIDDVIAAMNSGELRLGLHLIGLPNGGSEGFVTVGNEPPPPPPSVIPAPLGGMLAGAGLVAIGARRRR